MAYSFLTALVSRSHVRVCAIQAIKEILSTQIPVFVCSWFIMLTVSVCAKTKENEIRAPSCANHPVTKQLKNGLPWDHQPKPMGLRWMKDTLPANLWLWRTNLCSMVLCTPPPPRPVFRTDKSAFSFQGHSEASPGAAHVAPLSQFIEKTSKLLKLNQNLNRSGTKPRMQKVTDNKERFNFRWQVYRYRSGLLNWLLLVPACKALREEAFALSLVEQQNPGHYSWQIHDGGLNVTLSGEGKGLRKYWEKRRPDAVLPTMGGQTQLNWRGSWASRRACQITNVEMIGRDSWRASISGKTGNRFDPKRWRRIGLDCPRAGIAQQHGRSGQGTSD